MNARSRNDALHKLESLSEIILDHVLKLSLYPSNPAVKHWQAELDAFAGRLKKFNAGKSGKPNFTVEIIVEHVYSDRIIDIGLDFIEAYGPTETVVDLNKIKGLVREFAEKVVR